MEQNDLTLHVGRQLDELGVTYFITGSVASGIYGESRTTNDVDIVADLRMEHVDPFVSRFPADAFYLSREAVAEAVRRGSQFNLIDSESFIKVDVIVAGQSADAAARLARRRDRQLAPGIVLPVASPEDVIVMKLVYHREGGSERQLRDVVGILQNDRLPLDETYLRGFARQKGVEDLWDAVKQRAAEGRA